jgi:hypothetical protein
LILLLVPLRWAQGAGAGRELLSEIADAQPAAS